jgi:enoyl-CoA hydratase/carnithine racemase
LEENLILVRKEGNVCTITINQPQRRNTMNPEALLLLGDALNALAQDGETRAVVIRGAGDEAFSSGYDISRIGGTAQRELTGPRQNPLEYGMNSVVAFPYPVIAMIYGYAIGAGLELAVTCDLRFASDNARLGITPAKLGVVYRPEGILKFLNIVGVSLTKELFYSGRLITAQRARERGLVDYVFPPSELERATYDLAREIAENAPLSVSGTKSTIARLFTYQKLSPEDRTELNKLQARAMSSEDLKEGQRAFMEKRQPKFTGR